VDGEGIAKAVLGVTKKWRKQRKAEERSRAAEMRRRTMWSSSRVTVKEAAELVMEEAYLKASSNGTLPAHARQIMYAARDAIQEETGEPLKDQYFCQTILPDYLSDHPEQTKNWDVVFDARGHFAEPHSKRSVPLGTIEVRNYLSAACSPRINKDVVIHQLAKSSFPTCGPTNRYQAILFIEKEGFNPLFKATRLAERYDLAIMSTKGLSVTASRMLIDKLSGKYNIPVFTLHDFDLYGFRILGTLKRSNRRYVFENRVQITDLGLRLEDVLDNDLESEQTTRLSHKNVVNLKQNGATAKEIEFLREGQRVELNQFASADLIAWIESKLQKFGVQKVIPEVETLQQAYRFAASRVLVNAQLEKIQTSIAEQVKTLKIPDDLEKRIRAQLKEHPEQSWDHVVGDVVDRELK
jgi:hypothetical protein